MTKRTTVTIIITIRGKLLLSSPTTVADFRSLGTESIVRTGLVKTRNGEVNPYLFARNVLLFNECTNQMDSITLPIYGWDTAADFTQRVVDARPGCLHPRRARLYLDNIMVPPGARMRYYLNGLYNSGDLYVENEPFRKKGLTYTNREWI